MTPGKRDEIHRVSYWDLIACDRLPPASTMSSSTSGELRANGGGEVAAALDLGGLGLRP
jgi:hypothetical protein